MPAMSPAEDQRMHVELGVVRRWTPRSFQLGHLSLRNAEAATVGGNAGYIKKFLIP